MSVGLIISLILGSVSLIGFIYGIGFSWGTTKKEVDALKKATIKLCDEVDILNNQVSKLNTQISPFWNIVETKLAHLLHSKHTPTYDALLLKLKDDISYKELIALKELVSNDLDESIKKNNVPRGLLSSLVTARVIAKIKIYESEKKPLC